MALIYDVVFDSQTRILSLLDKAGNAISSCEVPSKSKELTLKATVDNSSVKLTKNGTLSNTYEVNVGSGWTAYEFGTVIPLNAGQSCKWRCSNHPTTQSTSNYVQFVMTGTIEASGNCNSMLSMNFENMTSLSGYTYAFYRLFKDCKALTKAPDLPATTLQSYCYSSMFDSCSALTEVRITATTTATDALSNWLSGVAASGDFYCNPNANFEINSASGIPANWNRWVLGAEDTGTTTTMYHNGTTETVRVGTSAYGVCYSAQGWAGFKSLDQMHSAGYTFGTQTQLTMYYYDERTVTAYRCGANNDDGYTGDMYCTNTSGFKSLSEQSVDGYYLTSTPWTGLKITSGTWTGNYTFRTSLYKVGTLSNLFQIDDGSGWRDYSLGTIVDLPKNSSLKFRRRSGTTKQSEDNYLRFAFTSSESAFTESRGKITVSGNPYSLLTKTGFDDIASLSNYPYALYKLFWKQNAIGSASGLVLPAGELSTHCYHDLFSTCEYLYYAPELPATTLAPYCYEGLYYGCIRLPSWYHLLLPATTLVEGCYMLLFAHAKLINEVRIAATNTTRPNQALNGWLDGTAASGTVYAPTSLKLPGNSGDGVPSGWTRHDIADYPTT